MTPTSRTPGTHAPRRQFLRLGGAAAGAATLAACTNDSGAGSGTGDSAKQESASSTTSVPEAISDSELPERADPPLRAIIDSDTANEIDDQFALAWALLAPEKIRIEAVTAAPFSFGDYLADLYEAQGRREEGAVTKFEKLAVSMGPEGIESLRSAGGPAAGMQESLAEINRVLDAAAPAQRPPAVPGSESFLPDADTPVESEAATTIIEAAHAGETPLYIPVMGTATNVASALLMDPSIGEKIVVVFVAGYPSASPHIDESFNILGDRIAGEVLFTKAPKLLYIPGYGVSEMLTVSPAEVDAYVAGRGALGDLLAGLMDTMVAPEGVAVPGNRRVMWDMAPVAWMIDPEWVPTFRTTRGTLGEDHLWSPVPGEMTEAYSVNDVEVFTDFFARLDAQPTTD